MINPTELHSYSQRTLAEKHQQAAMDQLAQIATGQMEQRNVTKPLRIRVRHLLDGLFARLRVARPGA